MKQHEPFSNKELGYRIHKLNFLLERRVERALSNGSQIGFSQFKILMALGRDHGVCGSQIADSLGITEAAVSRQVNALVEHGYIERHELEGNRRKFQLQVTDTGKSVTRAARSLLDESLGDIFGGLSEDDHRVLATLLDKLMTQLLATEDCNKLTNESE